MTTFIIGFTKHNGSTGTRTIKARDADEAIAKCANKVANSFWHFVQAIG
jgi:hypothetical protein